MIIVTVMLHVILTVCANVIVGLLGLVHSHQQHQPAVRIMLIIDFILRFFD